MKAGFRLYTLLRAQTQRAAISLDADPMERPGTVRFRRVLFSGRADIAVQ